MRVQRQSPEVVSADYVLVSGVMLCQSVGAIQPEGHTRENKGSMTSLSSPAVS